MSSRFFDLPKTAEALENKGISRPLLEDERPGENGLGPDRP